MIYAVLTFVPSFLDRYVPAAETVRPFRIRIRNQREDDLGKSAAIYNPLRESEKMVAV